ncbi:MAG: glycosyltransferase family 9 protein [Chloroflexi bacterium]|nr:glycosyltransferase family 9 protein [Chloroflexota bacterium]
MRILVVKLADLGDALTITPMLRALRLRYPAATIDVLATPVGAAVLEGLDSFDRVIVFEKHDFDAVRQLGTPASLARLAQLGRMLAAARYDRVFLCHHLTTWWGTLKYAALVAATRAPVRIGLDNGRGCFLSVRVRDDGFGARHEIDYWLALAGAADVAPRPRLEVAIPPAAERAAEMLLEGLGQPLVVLHPGSGGYSMARRWPVDRFAAVADALAERHGAQLVVVGGREEAALAAQLVARSRASVRNLVGQTGVKELAALLGRAQLVIANDGGIVHLAVAMGTPVVAMFGLSNHRAWGPYGAVEWRPGQASASARAIVVRRDLPCSPCLYRGHSLGNRQGCATRHCLTELAPADAIAAAEHLLFIG